MVTISEMRLLHKLKDQLRVVVDELVDGVRVVVTSDDGTTTVVLLPSLLDQLRDMITDRPSSSVGSFRAGSKPPIHVPSLDLYREIKKVWKIPRISLESSIRQMLVEMETWDHPSSFMDRIAKVETVNRRIRDILDPPQRFHLRDGLGKAARCPACRTRVVVLVSDAGERVQQPTLTLSAIECRCLHCGQVWPASQFEFLARVLLAE